MFTVFMQNYEASEYYKNNNCPFKLSITRSVSGAIKELRQNRLRMRVEFFDDWVDENGYHLYLSEDLDGVFTITHEEFLELVGNTNKSVDILWEKLGITKKYNIKGNSGGIICENENFITSMSEAILNLYIPEEIEKKYKDLLDL